MLFRCAARSSPGRSSRWAGCCLLAVSLLSGPSVAAGEPLGIGVNARLDLRYLRVTEVEPAPFDDHVTSGLFLRGFGGIEHVQLAMAFDVRLGASSPLGFAYGAHLRPLGLAVDDEGLRLSATAGIGLDGVTERLEPAARFPLDALLELPFEDAKLEIAGEIAWLPFDERRRDGARMLRVADESALSVRLRLNRRYDTGARRAENGYFLGLDLAERHRGLLIGGSLGYSLDASYGFR